LLLFFFIYCSVHTQRCALTHPQSQVVMQPRCDVLHLGVHQRHHVLCDSLGAHATQALHAGTSSQWWLRHRGHVSSSVVCKWSQNWCMIGCHIHIIYISLHVSPELLTSCYNLCVIMNTELWLTLYITKLYHENKNNEVSRDG
jgi:hypothetical protein